MCPETRRFESTAGCWFGLSGVGGLHLARRDVAAVFVEAVVVEPVDPFGGGDLDLVDIAPWPALLDQLGRVETVGRLGEWVVVR